MRKRAIVLLTWLMVVGPILGQDIRYQAQVSPSGIPSPVVRVCTEPASNAPCTPLANIFSDKTATTPLPNPFTGDTQGNYFFYASCSNTYHIQIYQNNVLIFEQADVSLPCGSGGGGTVGPGTVNQIAKFTAPNNVGDSSCGPDDGTHLVPCINGLSVNNSGYSKQRPNGVACTTSNLLVEYDGNVIGGLASVQTAALGSQNAIGVAIQGAGCTGNVQITDHGFGACVFDNQTVIHDLVISSGTTAGYCSDAGTTTTSRAYGRVVSLNTGAGTQAIVDWFTGDSQGVSGTVTSCATGGGANAYYPGIGQVISCDQYIKDDGAGGLTFNNPAYAGFHYWKQGPLPPAAPANTRMDTVPTSVTTHTVKHPGTAGATGQAEVINSQTTDANGNTVDVMSWGTAGGGVEAQVSGLDNANCTAGVCPLINFVPGSGIAITNTSGGNVQIASSASASQIANPIAPTLTVGGTPGASTVTYVVQLCEDGPSCTKHTLTSTATATTANATLSSSPITISAYADTIYGWRCANVYRTVGGPSQGLIANCTDKAVIDNGLAASAGSPTNTNTTALTPTMNPTSGGCDYPPGSPQGVDGLPCSPTAYDSEMTQTFGTPGDANDGIWTTTINASNFSAIAWTGGMLSMQSSNSTNGYQCIFRPFTSSTPYAFTELQFVTLGWNISVNGSQFGIVLRESATGKMAGIELEQDDHQYRLLSSSFTSPTGTGTLTGTVTSSNITVGQSLTAVNPGSYRLSNDGTNIHFWYSDSGVTFHEMGTGSTVASLFTTAPNQVGFCTNAGTGNQLTLGEVDYLRKTQ